MVKSTDLCNEEWSHALIKELVHQEIRDYFIAIGSRSTPLILAAERNPLTRTHIHFDERGLAFAALGFARAKKKPAAIIVTSGTAVANLYPAIVEACMDEVPLLILAADRPFELLQVGSEQAIDQIKMFGSYLKGEWILPAPSSDVPIDFVRSIAAKASHQTLLPRPGPVMINCMYKKPLSLDQPYTPPTTLAPQTTYLPTSQEPSDSSLKLLADLFSQHEKGMIIAGKLDEGDQLEEIFTLSLKLQWPIFADPTSNLRNIGRSSSSIPYFNSILKNTDAKKTLQPTIVLHVGDKYVSTHLQEWIASVPVKAYVHVSSHKTVDPYHQVSHRLECSPSLFAKRILPNLKGMPPSLWLGMWKEHSLRAEEYVNDFFEETEKLQEPILLHLLGNLARSDMHFFFGTSLPIRYADGYFYPRDSAGRVFATRGASGIDGNIAQAIGITKALDVPMICVIGDQTFLHDVNSLAMLTNSSLSFTLVVLNNFGSGIFSFLPISKQKDVFEKCFTAPHSFEVSHFAKAFSIEYAKVETPHEFTEIMKNARTRKSPLILEFFSDVEKNHEYLLSIDTYLSKELKTKSSLRTFYRDLLK
ncbi:MAG: 2-succinyl-5-enolpyruvyl-6-hydroxy-3-cyclohexene-1-carboxylic-acid synthase [Chlamydiae bacterium]|nr:2-succinyl-5-enolpyruvyl-6-hydroxy-3-cyclohexene-1-carboxylic-acid synthase [Chlamydiota bacterium]